MIRVLIYPPAYVHCPPPLCSTSLGDQEEKNTHEELRQLPLGRSKRAAKKKALPHPVVVTSDGVSSLRWMSGVLLGPRKEDNKYLVSWEGYGDSGNTWEPRSNIREEIYDYWVENKMDDDLACIHDLWSRNSEGDDDDSGDDDSGEGNDDDPGDDDDSGDDQRAGEGDGSTNLLSDADTGLPTRLRVCPGNNVSSVDSSGWESLSRAGLL